MNNQVLEKMYSVKELIALGIGSSSSIYRWIDCGELKKTKIGKLVRFKASDVQAFLENKNQTNIN